MTSKLFLRRILPVIILMLFLALGYRAYMWYTGRDNSGEFIVIELNGTPFDRGKKHGSQLKDEMALVFKRWKDNISNASGRDADSVLTEFLAETNFESAILKHNAALLEEVRGIAAGSGQPYRDVLAFQLVDEFWVYLDRKFNEPRHHCSALGVKGSPGQEAYIAQNMDLENYMNGFQIILHIPASAGQPEQYVLSCAGLIGLNGMNSEGVGVTLNTLMELSASPEGLPVAFMIRTLLEKRTSDEVLNFLTLTPHASGTNYIIGIADSIYDYEASANKVVRYIPENGRADIIYHTNHTLVNDDLKPWYRPGKDAVSTLAIVNDNSKARFKSLENQLSGTASLTAEHIKNTLRSKEDSDNPVCRPFTQRSGFFTFSSVVLKLTGKRSIQLTYGSPDRSEYKEFFFADN